jgi:hypothetical protein
MRRSGMTYRLHDFGPLTVACGGNFVCDGSHRWPKVDLILRDRWTKPSCTGKGRAIIARTISIPLPYVTFRAGIKHNSLWPLHRGAFVVSRLSTPRRRR